MNRTKCESALNFDNKSSFTEETGFTLALDSWKNGRSFSSQGKFREKIRSENNKNYFTNEIQKRCFLLKMDSRMRKIWVLTYLKE